jgi:hypothetical protein
MTTPETAPVRFGREPAIRRSRVQGLKLSKHFKS